MGWSEEFQFDASSFSGVARLFPLPDLVMFPHVMQPLHIFEARYRQMIEDCLADDQLLCMATLAPGWESDYEGRPPLYPIGCLGRVATHHRLDDGRFNLLLLGLTRVQILEELPPERLYRQARVQVLPDGETPETSDRAAVQQRLLVALKRALVHLSDEHEALDQLLGSQLPLGALTDIVAHALDLPQAVRIELLMEPGVDRRAGRLLEVLDQIRPMKSARPAAKKPPYPPEFSNN